MLPEVKLNELKKKQKNRDTIVDKTIAKGKKTKGKKLESFKLRLKLKSNIGATGRRGGGLLI